MEQFKPQNGCNHKAFYQCSTIKLNVALVFVMDFHSLGTFYWFLCLTCKSNVLLVHHHQLKPWLMLNEFCKMWNWYIEMRHNLRNICLIKLVMCFTQNSCNFTAQLWFFKWGISELKINFYPFYTEIHKNEKRRKRFNLWKCRDGTVHKFLLKGSNHDDSALCSANHNDVLFEE